jgi:phospholipid/cholesterol/gamma-HCH transport system substrate-binding protein
MKDDSKGIEWKVGVFMLIGLCVIAFMAVKFGKLSQGLKKYYTVIAEFPNASGLLKGADVYLAGARVGFTADAPELIDGRYAVRVVLKLKDGVKVPRRSSFIISSAGFLGDAFVSINPPPNPDLEDVLTNGEYVVGTRLEGFGDLAVKGGDVMDELKKRLQELETPIKDIRERVLSEKNLKNIDETFASISEISTNLKNTSKGFNEVVEKAKQAADTVKETVASAKGPIGKLDGVVQKVDSAASDLKGTLADIRKGATSVTKAFDSAKTLLGNANSGKGALGMLLADKETAENLKALIRNLREHGVLFYRDRSK